MRKPCEHCQCEVEVSRLWVAIRHFGPKTKRFKFCSVKCHQDYYLERVLAVRP